MSGVLRLVRSYSLERRLSLWTPSAEPSRPRPRGAPAPSVLLRPLSRVLRLPLCCLSCSSLSLLSFPSCSSRPVGMSACLAETRARPCPGRDAITGQRVRRGPFVCSDRRTARWSVGDADPGTGALRPRPQDALAASSAESVGEFWFGQVAKCVIQSDFQCPGGAEPIRPFGDHSGLSVEAFDNATGELPPGSEPVQNQVAVRAQPCGQPPSSGRAASASSGCTSGRGTGRPSTATRSPTAIESPP